MGEDVVQGFLRRYLPMARYLCQTVNDQTEILGKEVGGSEE